MNLRRASIHGVKWSLVQNLAGRCLSLVVVAIIGRILDRSAFGAIALAMTVTTFAELFTNQGYATFIAQTKELDDEHLDNAFWLSVVIGVVLAGIIIISATPLASTFAAPSVAPIVRLLSLSLVIRSLSVVPTGLLTRALKFRSLSFRQLFAAGLSGITGITAAFCGLGTYSLVLQILVADASSAIILWNAAGWRPRFKVTVTRIGEMTKFGAPIFASAIVGFVVRRLDTVVVLSALGIVGLAVYSMAQRIVQVVQQVLYKSYDMVVFSALSRVTEPSRREQAFREAVEMTATLCFPTFVGLAIAAGPASSVILGERWRDCGEVVTVLALSGVPLALSITHGAAMTSVAKVRYVLALQVLFGCVYFPVVFPLSPYGPASAAGAYTIACAAMLPIEIALVTRALTTRVDAYLKALAGPAIATASMAAVAILAAIATRALPNAIRLVIEAVVGIAGYVGALRLFAPKTFDNCVRFARVALNRPGSAAA